MQKVLGWKHTIGKNEVGLSSGRSRDTGSFFLLGHMLTGRWGPYLGPSGLTLCGKTRPTGPFDMPYHSAAKWPILRFRNGVGRSMGTVLGLIYID